MNNGKLFIIGGSVGLIASVIFLGRALFQSWSPDTQTPNINTGDQTVEISGSNDSQTLPLTSSGDKDSIINILVPEIIATQAFANIIKQAEKNNSIKIHVWVDTGQNYPDSQKTKILSWEYDLIILPSEKLTTYKAIAGKLEMGESLSPFVQPSFSEIVENKNFTYIPIGIDPFVTRTHTQDTLNIGSVANLFNQIVLRTQNKKLEIPILLWVDTGDVYNRGQNKESYPNQLLFLYTITNDTIRSLDSKKLKDLVDIVNYKTNFTWDSNNFRELVIRIWDRDPNCKQYPDICIRVYNFANARFWFLSDIYYINKYFSAQKESPIIGPFIATQSFYPTRARGAIVHKNTQNLISTMQFLNTLLTNSIQSWNRQTPLVSPYNGQANTKDIKRFDNQRDRQKIIRYSPEAQKNILENTPFVQLLQNQYNTNIFMQIQRPQITF